MDASLQMTSADQLRFKAAELLIRAARETDPRIQAHYESIAQSYLRLADLAEQNSKADIISETPPASFLR
jgi:hypothetical protein